MTNFGHTALRVYGKDYDVTYDFGRYRNTWGFLGSRGEGILRVWNSWNAFVQTQTRMGDLRLVTFKTSPQQDQAVMSYFQKLIESGSEREDKSGLNFKEFKLTQDYNFSRTTARRSVS